MARQKEEYVFEDVASFSDNAEYKKAIKAKKGRGRGLRVFVTVLSVLFILFGCGLLYVSNYILGGLTTNAITKDKDELGILSGITTDPKITNIALFGVDSRGSDFSGRSDAIMILTIDEVHKKVKMSSILRDIRVRMDDSYNYTDTGYDKLNHAYSFGGPEYAIKVLNQNFKLDIEDYVTVNFNRMASIVDAVGGIELTITDGERQEINKNLSDLQVNDDSVTITDADQMTESGKVHLNGNQAVAYARIRNIGDDSGRAERQQNVLAAVIKKIEQMNASEYPDMIRQMSSLCETSLDVMDIMGFVPFVVGGFTIESIVIPGDIEGYSSGIMENGGWMWTYDTDVAARHLESFIYENDALASESSSESSASRTSFEGNTSSTDTESTYDDGSDDTYYEDSYDDSYDDYESSDSSYDENWEGDSGDSSYEESSESSSEGSSSGEDTSGEGSSEDGSGSSSDSGSSEESSEESSDTGSSEESSDTGATEESTGEELSSLDDGSTAEAA